MCKLFLAIMAPPPKRIKPVTKTRDERPEFTNKEEEKTSTPTEGESRAVQDSQESVVGVKGTGHIKLFSKLEKII